MSIPGTMGDGSQARWILALLLLAFLVRFLPALTPHFWYDEIYTVALVQHTPRRMLALTAHDFHPPLYYYVVKAFGAAGRRLGGFFTTLAWLRLASILPGVLACLLGWLVARRAWGARPALWTLALFALSPALVYYSVDLRNYSTVHAFLLLALLGFTGFVAPRGRRTWGWAGLFACGAIAAFYTHSLSNLYLAAFGLLYLGALAARPAERPRLIRQGAAAFGLIALCGLPWMPFMFPAGDKMNVQDWMPWANARELALSLLWYFPLGPWIIDLQKRGCPWGVMIPVGAGLLALFVLAWRGRAGAGPKRSARTVPEEQAPADPPGHRFPDVLWLASAVLFLVPLAAAFCLSYFRVAKVFLGFRYNLIAAPFFNLLLMGLILGIPRRGVRRAVLAAVLLVSGALSLLVTPQRLKQCNEIQLMATYLEPQMAAPGARLCWLNPVGLPWLGRCGPYTIGSSEDALHSAAQDPSARAIYFIAHAVLSQNFGFHDHRAALLENILRRRGIQRITKENCEWASLWRLEPGELAGVAAAAAAARQAIERRRFSIPGGQVLLADDPAFPDGRGWSAIEAGADLMPSRWTAGPRQRLAWPGPAKPGRYALKLVFWRAQPYPLPEIEFSYRLPGQGSWVRRRAGLGAVTIEGAVDVRAPGQKLQLELDTPTWIPAKIIPGSDDRRELGMIFVALELRPIK